MRRLIYDYCKDITVQILGQLQQFFQLSNFSDLYRTYIQQWGQQPGTGPHSLSSNLLELTG